MGVRGWTVVIRMTMTWKALRTNTALPKVSGPGVERIHLRAYLMPLETRL